MSGAGFVVGGCDADWTVVATVAACDRPDEVPVKVMLPVALDAVEAAVRVIFCAVVGVTLTVAGDAVTPAGSPVMATETVPLKELIAVAEIVMSDPEPPAWRVTAVGATESEKSGEAEDEGVPVLGLPDLEPPHEVRNTAQDSRDRKLQNLERESTPGRPLQIDKLVTTL